MNKEQQQTKVETKNNDIDFTNNFIKGGRFPVYEYKNLRTVSNSDRMKVEKIPMYVDGVVAWTHFKIELRPSWRTEPLQTDVDIRLTLLEGKIWLLIQYKGQNGGDILEAGDIVIIPAGAIYHVFNNSQTEISEYTLDANTLLEITD